MADGCHTPRSNLAWGQPSNDPMTFGPGGDAKALRTNNEQEETKSTKSRKIPVCGLEAALE